MNPHLTQSRRTASRRAPDSAYGALRRGLSGLMVALLAACQPAVRLMPTPVVFASGTHSPFTAQPVGDITNQVHVFYATNRLPIGPRAARVYTILPGQTLFLGAATVRIGPQEKTWESLYELSTTPSPARRPVLKLDALEEFASVRSGDGTEAPGGDAGRYFEAINAALARSSNKDLTIYVHGSNSTVERAAAQAAQYRHFTGRQSVVLAFIWPSAGSGLRYFTDVHNARLAVPLFKQLCDLLTRHTVAEHINVLAYSAGAQIVSPALAAAGRRSRSDRATRLRLGEVYLAAPDIALPSFVAQLPLFIDLARRVTVSANLNDAALSLSRWLHGVSRLGNPDPSELSEQQSRWLIGAAERLNFDLISVKPTVMPGLPRRSHSFWYDHPWVSSDVLMKLQFHAPPDARGLTRNRTAERFPYWTFPPDYERRVVDIKRRLAAATGTAPTATGPLPQRE